MALGPRTLPLNGTFVKEPLYPSLLKNNDYADQFAKVREKHTKFSIVYAMLYFVTWFRRNNR